ncbi:MAG: hypothetical protein OWS74_00555 [Firmicutes bacterium]|nr:hypothetical protein [Bacillota bacterium]
MPKAPRMPYQLWLVAKRHQSHPEDALEEERVDGVRMMQAVVRAYDRFFGKRTAYVMGLMQAPSSDTRGVYHWRWEFLPIDRSPDKIKYLAGSEMGMGAYIADVLPEQTLEQLAPLIRQEWEQGSW